MSDDLNQLNEKLAEVDEMRDKLVEAIRSASGQSYSETESETPDRVMVGKRKAKNFAEWMAFKKKNPRQYYSGVNQAQMAEDREAMSKEEFYAKKS